jgi:hypothetical protein
MFFHRCARYPKIGRQIIIRIAIPVCKINSKLAVKNLNRRGDLIRQLNDPPIDFDGLALSGQSN